jgi:hypothetical protein
LIAGWGYTVWDRRRRVHAADVDTTQAKDKSDRELLETVYSVMITPDPTPLVPHPPPGLIERVDNVEKALSHVREIEAEIADGHIRGVVSPPKE